ncbi:type II toxin-antitoxin system HipA family toxin [Sutterella sp.]|uniref:type II toxin-antitoxin system HipA family toxin n=1 Tax=Sutterella sp. TaxID=1981025 RepID=UPI003FD6CBC4
MENVRKLLVYRTLQSGGKTLAGRLVEMDQGLFFEWDAAYRRNFPNGSLSPFRVPYVEGPQRGPQRPNQGLHGFLADSLPDGWGLLLMDRAFQEHGVLSTQVGPLDRLAFIGERAVGALSFRPEHPAAAEHASSGPADFCALGEAAVRVFEDETDVVLPQLLESGTSGGSRPKATLWFSEDFSAASTAEKPGWSPWLVKFTSRFLPLGHEEGIWEAAALESAQAAGIQTVEWRLFEGPRRGAKSRMHWFGVGRFDRTPKGRTHFASVAGLLDVDFRMPSLDYADLVRVTAALTRSRNDVLEILRRAVFNFMIGNADDHAKNFGFLLSDDGVWRLSPAFDITFSPGQYGEHATSFGGGGRTISRSSFERMAAAASLTTGELRRLAEEAASAAEGFADRGAKLGASKTSVVKINKTVKELIKTNLQAVR